MVDLYPEAAPKIVVADDLPTRASSLVDALAAAGFRVERVATADEVLTRVEQRALDLAVLDSVELVRAIRERGHCVPLLVITPSRDLAPRVAAFDHGADDVLARPFVIAEAVARCHALVRRARGPAWAAETVG